ncbi:MAG: metallophosphoesterase family protein [Deltaproteobacteria bacterium]|nr:metallophosphoesterase family protein [Deltaproteobacteria bacterium]
MHQVFRSRRLMRAGVRNLLNIRTRRVSLAPPGLPRAFDGFSILLLSDMHLGSIPELGPAVVRVIEGLRADVCVFAGDFRLYAHQSGPTFETDLRRIVDAVRAPAGLYGVLGNHDTIDDARLADCLGIRMLVNEAVSIRRDGATIRLAGVDDPHTYRLDDLDRALAGAPKGAFTVLAAHTSEIAADAAHKGVGLYLCGHTHGGQICLPGGVPLLVSTRSPRAYACGEWDLRGMKGYTSAGVGASIVPARFNCPGEVVTIEMRAKSSRTRPARTSCP